MNPTKQPNAGNCLVAGAASGIGLAVLERHLKRGGRGVGTYHRANKELYALLNQFPSRLKIAQIDLADQDSVESAAERLTDPIDLLANSGAIYGPRGDRFGDVRTDAILEAINVNCLGLLRVSRGFKELMAAPEHPRIVAISSLIGTH